MTAPQPAERTGHDGGMFRRPDTGATVLVKAHSHRAREKLYALVGRENTQQFFSLHRSTAKGAIRIPSEHEEAAMAIVGITRMRDGDDLMRCWS